MERKAFETQLKTLAPRESEVMALVADGMSNPGIALRLSISRKTVENTITRARRRFRPSLTRQEFIQHWWRHRA